MREIVLIMDNIRSVYNTASLFRTADCFGIQEIILAGTTPSPIDRFGRERSDFAKVSLGSEKNVTWKYYTTTTEALLELKSNGFYIVAVEQSQQSKNLHTVKNSHASIALILGNEVEGVEQNILDMADEIYEISQFGQKESLNVSVAGAIALYHLRFIAGDL